MLGEKEKESGFDRFNHVPRKPINYRRPSVTSTSKGTSSSNNGASGSLFKVQKISIPTFNGNIREWRHFWSAFEAAVHNVAGSNAEKLNYLNSVFRGDASTWLKGFDLDESLYPHIIEKAHERFGNRSQLINAYYDDLKAIVSAKTAMDERKNLDTVKKCVAMLKALKADTEQEMLKGIIVPKFPKETMRWAFRCLIRDPNMQFSVNELIETLSILVGIDELVDSYFTPSNSSSSSTARSLNQGRQDRVLAGGLMAAASSHSSCLLCSRGGGRHRSENCFTYDTYAKRKERFTELHLCFLCGAGDHQPRDCPTRNRNCSVCGSRGHSILTCIDHLKSLSERNKKVGDKRPAGTSGNFLETFTAYVISPSGDAFPVRGIIDNGSTYSYVSNDLVSKLRLKLSEPQLLSVGRFGTTEASFIESGNVNLTLASRDRKFERSFHFLTTPCISGNISTCPPVEVVNRVLPPSYNYADPQIFDHHKDQIDILVGSNFQYEICSGKIQRLENSLVLRQSIFGWIPTGEIYSGTSVMLSAAEPMEHSGEASSSNRVDAASAELDSLNVAFESLDLEKMWSLEALGIKPSEVRAPCDSALRDFQETHTFENGRFTVCWPWKEPEKIVNGKPQPRLPKNKRMCMAHLRSLIERSSPELLRQYHAQIQEQLDAGIIEVAPHDSKNATEHYLPHRAVVKDDKLRIVNDGSAKTKGGESINDKMEKGPSLIEDLVGLFFGFREFPIGLSADIEKAFLQILLNEIDRDSVRFLWVKDPFKPLTPDNIVIYRFTRVPFGIIASPFLLNIVLQELLCMQPTNHWLLLARKAFYVDNFVKSFKTKEDAYNLYKVLVARLKSASFNLRGWVSNDEAFLKAIKSPLTFESIAPVSVLGLMWDVQRDTLSVKRPLVGLCTNPTKRSILQYYASIFDPLGFFGPTTLPLKLLIQKCWKGKFDWDAVLPSRLVAEWQKFFKECQAIFDIAVQRRIFLSDFQGPITLHVFSDASIKAYACCAYLTYYDPDSARSESSLVFAKVRVAPASFENKARAESAAAKKAHADKTKEALEKGLPLPEPYVENELLTIPELELLAALIGARVAKFIRSKFEVVNTVLWTDATTVLQWLKSNKVLPMFVKNRVKEINDVKNLTIRYVPSKENPADIASRGCSAEMLKSNTLWWNGPSWVCQEDLWPSLPENTEIVDTNLIALLAPVNPKPQSVLLPDSLEHKFKSWDSAVNLFKCYNRFRYRHLKVTPSSLEEHMWAEDLLILELQKKYFAEERAILKEKGDKQKIRNYMNLGLFIRSENTIPHDGFIRCGGRLQNSSLPWGTIHPILLPRQSPLVRLLIKKLHIKNHHVGTSHLLAKLRERFWVVKARSLINSVVHQCLSCRAWEGGAYQLPPMDPLPLARVTKAHAFLHIGIDYVGPLNIYEREEPAKAYVCMFVCLVTRAVHLEPARDLSAAEFLLCMERFTSRRGMPQLVISDNATNFTFVQPLIGTKVEILDKHVDTFYNSNRICWKFIPAYSPWHGGAYERLVSLVKRSLKKAYGFDRLDFVRYMNALCRIENIINSRPLTYVSSNEVIQPLTPNHFIRLRDANVLTELEVSTHSLQSRRKDLLETYYYIPEVLDSFWEVFHSQYLTSLRERHVVGHKPVKGSLPFVPNKKDLVLISEPHVPRSLWSAGIIRSLDKSARVATVESISDGKLLIRSINQLYPLELPTSESHVMVPKSCKDPAPIVAPMPKVKRSCRKRRKVQ